ncbi:hypothetical protein TrST_g1593 [Triparma strigata]|uniref:Menorin-like domain-containing protein n=1 Tax=Triparma strigata TaxID=1606541 RepID=A0A9W7A0F1_9STRA|nr:hypothetical protein TrST_g1593 [Triparma strigata]
MAHPPSRSSELPFSTFLKTCQSNVPRKHLKLDFKEIEAVEPCLKMLKDHPAIEGQGIYLNADVLPGPGNRGSPPTCDASTFLSTVLKHTPVPCLSLGFSCHVARTSNPLGTYLPSDVTSMISLCEQYDLSEKSAGIVFALNLRIAMKDLNTVKGLLAVPNSQILFWTGTGEPSVHKSYLEWVETEMEEFKGRVAFDCKIAETSLEGYKNEFLIKLINTINRFRGLGL